MCVGTSSMYSKSAEEEKEDRLPLTDYESVYAVACVTLRPLHTTPQAS